MMNDYDTLLNYFKKMAPTGSAYGGLFNLFSGNYSDQPRRYMFKRYTPEEPPFSNMSLRQRRPSPSRWKPMPGYQKDPLRRYMFKRYTPEEPPFSNMSLRQRRPLPARQKPTSDYQREWVEGYMGNMEGPARRLTPPITHLPGIPYRPVPPLMEWLMGNMEGLVSGRGDAPWQRDHIRRGDAPWQRDHIRRDVTPIPKPKPKKRREDAPTRRLIRRGVTPSARRPQEGTISSRLDSLRSQRRAEQRKLSNYSNRRKRASRRAEQRKLSNYSNRRKRASKGYL